MAVTRTHILFALASLALALFFIFSLVLPNDSNQVASVASSTTPGTEPVEDEEVVPPTATTTEPSENSIATTTPEQVATTTEETTTTEPTIQPSNTPTEPVVVTPLSTATTTPNESVAEAVEFTDLLPRTPQDCRTPEALAFFRHPGECMRALNGGF